LYDGRVKLSRAVWYMAASALGFSVMSMLVKIASERLPTGEIVLARAVVTLAASYVMVRRARLPLWGTNRKGLALRGVLGFGGLSLYYLSLAHLPLADATTIQNTTPLLTSLLAWWVLKESVGWSTAFALACGIGGVTLVVHPSGTGLDPLGVAIGLGAACCSALAYVTVRQLAKTEHPLVIVFYFPLIATPLVVPWAVATWVTPEPMEWLLLLAIGLSTQVGQVFMTMALVIERAGRVTSIGYIQVAFAMIWQWAIFGAPPTIWTIAGAALIVGGTTVIAMVSGAEAGSPSRRST
jgi:drug/metabolite transporter (DMT)-like permease